MNVQIAADHGNRLMTSTTPSSIVQPGVDGQYLVVATRTALPQRCIVTNEPVSESEYQIWDLPSIPRWLVTLMYVSPLLVMAAPYMRWRCKIKAGLSKRIRRRVMAKKAMLLGLMALPFLSLVSAIATKTEWLLPVAAAGLVLDFFWLPIFMLRTTPLKVHKMKGEHFWLEGCSPAFLASLSPSTFVANAN
jgi:hypothetical protein